MVVSNLKMENGIKMTRFFLKCMLLALLASSMVSAFAASETTFTGQVGDAMCVRTHMMPGKDEATCTRACIKEGSSYALIVGDKVYTLEGKLDGLDALAGKTAVVTGSLKAGKIVVSSVAAPK